MLLNTRGRNRGSRPKHFLRPPVVRMVYEVLLTEKSIFHCVCQNIDQKLRDWLIGNQSVFGNWRQFWTGGTTRSRRKFGGVGHQNFSSLECQVGFLRDAVRLNDPKKKKVHHYLVSALQWSIVFYGGDGEKSETHLASRMIKKCFGRCDCQLVTMTESARDIKSSACLISSFLHSICDILKQRLPAILGKNKPEK
jgi:hypothetical protein